MWWYVIRNAILANWKKIVGTIALALGYAIYALKCYLLEREREESDNLRAELERERQSNEAIRIIDAANREADKVVHEAEETATDMANATDGDKIAAELTDAFNNK